jgi:hypothetical protein
MKNVEKFRIAGQATYDNMAHAHYTQDTYSYKHTLCICNTYCFSTTTNVALLNVTLYVHFLPCLKLLPGSLAFKD